MWRRPAGFIAGPRGRVGAPQLRKPKPARESNTHAEHPVGGGSGAVQRTSAVEVGGLGLVDAGMHRRKGCAKTLMGNVPEKCAPSGGDSDNIAFNESGRTSPPASGNTTATEMIMSVVDPESYACAIAALQSGSGA